MLLESQVHFDATAKSPKNGAKTTTTLQNQGGKELLTLASILSAISRISRGSDNTSYRALLMLQCMMSYLTFYLEFGILPGIRKIFTHYRRYLL